MGRKGKRSYSITEFMRRLLLFAIPIVIINIIISAVSVVKIHQQNQEAIHNTLVLYQEETAAKISATKHFILWTTMWEPLVGNLQAAEGVSKLAEAMNTLRTRVNDTLYTPGLNCQYVAYMEEKDIFFNASQMTIPYSDYISIKEYICDQVADGTIADRNLAWCTFCTEKNTYLHYLISYRDFTFAVFIPAADLAGPLLQLDLGERGYLEVTDLDGQTLYLSNPDARTTSQRTSSLFYSLQSYEGKPNSLPFNIYIYSDNFSGYGTLLILQILIVFSAILFCIIFASVIFGMYFRVIKPIEQFSKALSNLDDIQSDQIDLEDYSIQELTQANTQFKNLIQEIKRLRIDIYEKELDQKRFQIILLQNQIRPHFYLNCLTTISSMAQLEDYQSIQSMVMFTSSYFRYLFQTDRELVPLEYELAHIQAYLDIQSLRYGPIFAYECHVDEEIKRAQVLPLLLITFIENALKHGMSGSQTLKLSLTAVRENAADHDRLQIDICDSGQGFPQSILDKIEHGEEIREGLSSHIGITNSIKRLSLAYGTDYKVAFSNDSGGGAHVRLVIPLQIKDD